MEALIKFVIKFSVAAAVRPKYGYERIERRLRGTVDAPVHATGGCVLWGDKRHGRQRLMFHHGGRDIIRTAADNSRVALMRHNDRLVTIAKAVYAFGKRGANGEKYEWDEERH